MLTFQKTAKMANFTNPKTISIHGTVTADLFLKKVGRPQRIGIVGSMGCTTSSKPEDETAEHRLSQFKKLSVDLSDISGSLVNTASVFVKNSLKSNPLFSLLLEPWNAEEIKLLVEAFLSNKIRVNVGDTVVDIGDTSKDVLIIASGCINVYGSENEILNTLESGDLIGEIGFLSGIARTERYVAKRVCVFYRLTMQNYEAITESVGFIFRRHTLLRKVPSSEHSSLAERIKILKFKNANGQKTRLKSLQMTVDPVAALLITKQALCVVIEGIVSLDDRQYRECHYFRGYELLASNEAIASPITSLMIIDEATLALPAMDRVEQYLGKRTLPQKDEFQESSVVYNSSKSPLKQNTPDKSPPRYRKRVSFANSTKVSNELSGSWMSSSPAPSPLQSSGLSRLHGSPRSPAGAMTSRKREEQSKQQRFAEEEAIRRTGEKGCGSFGTIEAVWW